jgi:hypothetical protein
MKKPLEKDIQRQCLEWLRLRGVLAWRANSGAMTATYKGKTRFLKFNGIDGLSDIVGVLPGGRFLACEVKRPGNTPTEDQEHFLGLVRDAGGLAVVVTSVDELIREVEAATAVQSK